MAGIRSLDRLCAALVAILGVVHLYFGRAAFTAPTTAGVWFASAGFLLIVTGLANLAASEGASRMQTLAALAGSVAILILGFLISRADPHLLREPQTLVLLALGAFLTLMRLRALARRGRRW